MNNSAVNLETTDTIAEAKKYLSSLEHLDFQLENAHKQIIYTFEETEKTILDIFTNAKNNIVEFLSKRQEYLLDKARNIKCSGITPLEECRNIILDKIKKTTELINVGEKILQGASNDFSFFLNNARLLGSLPEVPQLKEVPYITFKYDTNFEKEVKNMCLQMGEVSRIAPVQISELSEKPGGILVEWQSMETEDQTVDIQEFRLQRAFGNVIKEKHLVANFIDCYRGVDSQCLVKDLQVDQPYSFRVCCKFEGCSDWSPWSVPQFGKTTLKAFSWLSTDGFTISNEGKIAKPIIKTAPILFSDGPQFCVGHSVEFTFLEVDPDEAIIGLIWTEEKNTLINLKLIKENTFLLDRYGHIYVDGVEKSTLLPEFTKGLKVYFTCDLVNESKVRINIDSNDKRVTYDWSIPSDSKMYFVSQFWTTNWKVMVE